jgi:hypothetical protein
MQEIDWTIIGCKWRRWHPVDPIQMKRHGDNPKPSPPERFGGEAFPSQSRKWLMERLTYPPQVRLVFGEVSPQLTHTRENFEDF